jgi:N-acetylglucosaminyldiphosphoundecaprenol N-acetyl-beta-D-mannosaminyltransferase
MADRILCVQLADIGDLVLTLPALADLRHALPDAHLTLLTTPHAAPVVANGAVDAIIRFDKHAFDSPRALLSPAKVGRLVGLGRGLRAGAFQTVIFFHHFSTWGGVIKFIGISAASGARRRVGLTSERTPFLNAGIPDHGFGAVHQADYWRRLVRVITGDNTDPAPVVPIAQMPPPPLPDAALRIAVHAGSGGYAPARRWDPEKFAAVAARLIHQRGAQVILVGGAGDDSAAVMEALPPVARAHTTDLTGQTDLPQLTGVLASCDLFIGADSGVMHIAAAVGVPVAAVFGPSNAAAWHPYTPQRAVLQARPRCSPCSYVGTGVRLREGCAARTCVRLVTADAVYAAAAHLLDGDSVMPEHDLRPPPPIPPQRDRVIILGVPVDKLTYAAWLDLIGVWVAADDGLHHMCTVNPEFVMIAQRDPNFYHILQRADLCLADGIGLLYAARFLGEPLPGRVTGSDGVPRIAERAAQAGWRLYLLGAWEGVAERAAEQLRQQYPAVQIVGTFSGSPRPEDEDALVERVNAARADILLVAYGAPVQDKWIARNAPRLNVKVAMGVGGTFDYIAGDVPLAPAWMRRAGLEWLFRLVRQPWRARRQLRLPAFVLAVLWWKQRPIRHR